MEKWQLARNALFQGVGVAEVATQFGLKVHAVRRLSAGLRQPGCTTWQEIVRSWGLTDLVRALPKIERSKIGGLRKSSASRKRPSKEDLLNVFGPSRINALTTYCGISREDLLKSLTEELPQFIAFEALWTAFETTDKPGTKSAILEAMKAQLTESGFGNLAT
jgi:uncharacterized protein YidB (DUF937 family)